MTLFVGYSKSGSYLAEGKEITIIQKIIIITENYEDCNTSVSSILRAFDLETELGRKLLGRRFLK